MTLAALRSYDATIAAISVAWARGDAFCIETTGTAKHHLHSSDFTPAACARPPAAG